MQQCSHFSPAQWANKVQHVPGLRAGETPGKPTGLRGLIPSESLGLQCVCDLHEEQSFMSMQNLTDEVCGCISTNYRVLSAPLASGGRFGVGQITVSQRLCPEFLMGCQGWG